jgi:hypothetical protein
MTTKIFNQTAKATLASVAILFASFTVANAATAKSSSDEIVKIATERLDMYNAEMERTVKFSAPAIENADMEVATATSDLEAFFSAETMNNLYSAPVAQEGIADLETSEVLQNLDALSAQLEQSVNYRAE